MQRVDNATIQALRILIMSTITFVLCVARIYGGEYPASSQKVVETYVKLDYKGKGLDGEGYREMLKFTNWTDGPGWDTVMVIKGYRIGNAKISGKKTFVPVKYEVLGSIDGYEWKDVNSTNFTAEDRKEINTTFVLVKKAGRWVIDAPQYRPHVYVGIIRNHLNHLMKDSSHPLEQRKDLENTIRTLDMLLNIK